MSRNTYTSVPIRQRLADLAKIKGYGSTKSAIVCFLNARYTTHQNACRDLARSLKCSARQIDRLLRSYVLSNQLKPPKLRRCRDLIKALGYSDPREYFLDPLKDRGRWTFERMAAELGCRAPTVRELYDRVFDQRRRHGPALDSR